MLGIIHEMVAVLRRLDTTATANTTGGGYDDVMGTTILVDDGTQLGETTRVEHEAVRVPVQMGRKYAGLEAWLVDGHDTQTKLVLTTTMDHLQNLGLATATRKILIMPGDRIEAIEDTAGNPQIVFEDPGKMYVREIEPCDMGLDHFGTSTVDGVNLVCKPDRQGGVR